jgi:LEA14-like dessication related protein
MRQLACIFSIALFLSLISCAEFKPCTFNGIESAKVISVSSTNIELELNVKIKNPNNFGFSIYPSDFDVKLGNKDLGKASLSKKVRIKANSEIIHTFIIHSDLSKVMAGGMSSLISLAKSKNAIVAVHGELKTGNLFYKKRFPVDLKENIPLSR